MRKSAIGVTSTLLLIGTFLAGAGGAVADENLNDENVDLQVEVGTRYPGGSLIMSVDAAATSLVEVESGDPMIREFTGKLPTVTVTDTRSEVTKPSWYVLGSAADFVSGEDIITSDHMGWTPELAEKYGMFVLPGDEIESVIDDPDSEGLSDSDGELLYINAKQEVTMDQIEWSATAQLSLKVAATEVKPGTYKSVMTLSLFE
jgi:hypothetical protein